MAPTMKAFAAAAFAGLVMASPAPQALDFGALEDAPEVPSGPSVMEVAVTATTVSLATDITISSIATASATAAPTTAPAKQKRVAVGATTDIYPALMTSYTTDPASAATSTTTANQPCVTQPEAGTYCGFINPEDACAPQPDGYGPVPTPDTASAFLAYSPLHSMAQAAPTNIPSTNGTSYNQVFQDLNASVSASSYLGLFVLQTYDATICAAQCDANSLCTAFNIYAERDPSLNPTDNDNSAPSVWGYNCPNPASMTTFKCTLWGSNIDASLATNYGSYREQFQIVITASDGYDKTNDTTPPDCTPPSTTSTASSTSVATSTSSSLSSTLTSPITTSSVVSTTSSSTISSTTPSSTISSTSSTVSSSSSSSTSTKATTTSTTSAKATTTSTTSSKATTSSSGWGSSPSSQPSWPSHPWGPPQSCGGKAITAPKYAMGSHFAPGPYNPQVCSDFALLQNAANAKAGSNSQCKMFNAYYLHKNGVPFGTYCTLFSTHLEPSWATFSGQKSPSGDKYECKQSWTYTLL